MLKNSIGVDVMFAERQHERFSKEWSLGRSKVVSGKVNEAREIIRCYVSRHYRDEEQPVDVECPCGVDDVEDEGDGERPKEKKCGFLDEPEPRHRIVGL